VEKIEQGLALEFAEEVLGRRLRQELDLLAVDQRPASDREWERLARRLGLAPGPGGSLQPAGVNALPTLSGRGGVFLAGEAKGTTDPRSAREEVAHSLAAMRRLLDGSGAPAAAGQVLVDRRACALCLTCVRVCPHQAMGRHQRRPVPNPLACTGCGTCAAECPMDAIQLVNQEDARYRRQIRSGVRPLEAGRAESPRPEVLMVACAQGAAPALAAARAAGRAAGEGLRTMQVPCAGKVDPEMVLAAFRQGFDVVCLAACHPQACYSLTGNLWAGLRVEHLRTLLAEAGFEPGRLLAGSLAPAMAAEAGSLAEAALQTARELGPNPLKAAAREREFLRSFEVRVDEAYTIVA
jgi:coenzyme F420-reducing hydrogenase delta subunit/Pyruvate/2-oxoacid:ferredoxin oxidoreductase delta subunit